MTKHQNKRKIDPKNEVDQMKMLKDPENAEES
jgi:hypothetical protein